MPRHVDPLVVAAARDNATWCAAVCRANGIASQVDGGLWVADAPTPDGYPEAVTLEPGRSPEVVAAALPTGATSVKDSFADLDLAGAGFRVRFEARWIAHAPVSARPSGLRVVSSPDELAAWAAVHGGGEAFAPALLEDPNVVVLASGDPITAGAVLTDAGAVVGVSNVFGGASAYDSIVDEAARRFPGRTVVGWEAGEDLPAAEAVGFRAIGDLRVWVR